MRILAGYGILLLALAVWLPAQSKPKPAAPKAAVPKVSVPKPEPAPPSGPQLIAPTTEKLTYGVEWRLVRAGTVLVESRTNWARLKLESAGLVSKLFKVDDVYAANYDDGYCSTVTTLDAIEGKRHRETRVQYDRAQNHAYFTERDVTNNAVVRTAEVAVPYCVHDVAGAFLTLRGVSVEPGRSLEIPVSDGRRFAQVKMDAQEREEVKTILGAFKTIRYEAALMNGVVYPRKGRVFIWLTDDQRHLPVQIQVKMSFPVGTITLGLEKEEHL